MERSSTLLLRLAAIVIGLIALAFCIFAFPALWGGAQKEYGDMAYMIQWIVIAGYASVIPFFIALSQAWRLLGFVDKKRPFTRATVTALKRIMYCAFVITVFIGVSLPFFYQWAQAEDAPGLVVIGMFFTAVPFVVGVFAGVLQSLFASAVKIKSENDLTV